MTMSTTPQGPQQWPPTSPTPRRQPGPVPSVAPDPGSPKARLIALVVLIVFFGMTFYFQQKQHSAPLPAPGINPGHVDPPGADPTTLVSKLAVKFSHAGFGAGSGQQLMPQIDEGARTPAEKIRAATVAGDLLGPEEAIDRLKAIASEHGLDESLVTGAVLEAPAESPAAQPEADVPPETDVQAESPQDATSPPTGQTTATDGVVEDAPQDPGISPLLVEDLQTLGAIYRGQESAVSDQQREGLIDRHEWFARLALTQSLDKSDPARQEVIGGGGALLAFTLLIGLGFLVAFVTGLGLLIYFLIRIFSRKVNWRMDPPVPGGSVYLETAAVFVLVFVVFKLGMEFLLAPPPPAPGTPVQPLSGPQMALRISAQWLLLLPVLWPLVRGVSFEEMRRAIGLHGGRGVLREMGAGIVAYFAGIPILFGTVLATFILMIIWEAIKSAMGQPPSPPPENPIIDVIGGSDPWVVVSFVVLATLWAPIVEETIFRGCLYRHARSRVGPIIAGIVTAIVFGGMHGYAGPLLLPVTSLGFIFAMMREWRGSLVAPMTAHFLHNATVTAILLVFLSALGP